MEKASHLGQVRAAGVFTSTYAVLGIVTASIPTAPRSNHVAVSQIHSRLGKVTSTPIATAETAKGTSSNAVDIEVRRRRSIMGAVDLGWADYSRVRRGWRRKPRARELDALQARSIGRGAHSIAMGGQSIGFGASSIARGRQMIGAGVRSIALGWQSIGVGGRSGALGVQSIGFGGRPSGLGGQSIGAGGRPNAWRGRVRFFVWQTLSMRTLQIRSRTNPTAVAPPSNSPAREGNSRFASELENSLAAMIHASTRRSPCVGRVANTRPRERKYATPSAASGFQPPDTLAPLRAQAPTSGSLEVFHATRCPFRLRAS